mmetsp:Transcript_36436/g.145564  ORF Transcript_36436/g.145564 Transcript_36436/m.145564 type:complete len:711 (-) Transcript_36436:1373-3505(-)|eukprot:CAMPEP_0113957576 /NCGR_PEP_ID=MMETSP0011_2-20120614/2857_1 /TAXON_ID=101924 /ORGANISM="Rhodosorus marinus" /LENGTH=710 /DNA_ID=CAMNT_0000968175 /DNA_START=308 /DNA_END=2440 /DNA_ORIENTATION=+ /assembly_acc=CAM_ASM_000156
MDEILELQRQLAAVQLEGTTTRMSETNCVELVSKLLQAGRIDVVFTVSGREYLTRERVRSEIADEVVKHGGRLNVVEAAALIGVDLHHVEVELKRYFEENGESARRIQGDIITDDYFDSCTEEIGDVLSETGDGIVSLSDIATKYNLPIDTVRSMLEKRVGIYLKGYLEGGSLYTESHIARSKARVCGMLRGAATPISVGDVAKVLGIRTKIVNDALEELIATGRVNGSLRGRGERAAFTPSTFEKTRDEAIDNFFRTNQYVELDRLRQFSVADPKKYVASKIPNGLLLTKMVISNGQVDQLRDTIVAALSSKTWLDSVPLLPATIDPEDSALVLQAALQGHQAMVAEDRFIVSPELKERCWEVFVRDSETKALQVVMAEPQVDIPQQELVETGTKKTKSKRKKSKNEDSKTSGSLATNSVRTPTEEEAQEILNADGDLMHMLEKDHLGESAEDCAFVEALIAVLYNELGSIYSAAEAQAREKLAKERAEKAKLFERELATVLPKIEVHLKAMEAISDTDLRKMLDEHLMETYCSDARKISLQYFSGESEVPPIGSFPPKAQKHVRAFVKASTVQEFLQAYDDHGVELCLPPRTLLDKKKEKALSQTLRSEVEERLLPEHEPLNVLLLSSVLVFARSKGGAVLKIPPRAVPFLVQELQQSARGTSAESLFRLHDLVVESLKPAEAVSTTQADDAIVEAVQEVRNAVLAAQ